MTTAALTLIGKPGCHLCDVARDVIIEVIVELAGMTTAPEISITEVSILDDAELHEKYVEEIPVVLLNGRVHTIWRVDSARLRSAILAL